VKVIKKIPHRGGHMKSLVSEFEELLFRSVKNSYPDNWSGDQVTESILTGMCSLFSDKTIHVPGSIITTKVQAFRLVEEPENRFGDVSVLVVNSYHDGQVNEGVSFLSVKAKDPDKNTFSEIRKDHLKKINSNSPHSQLLLYDYDNISGMAFPTLPEAVIGNYPHNWNRWLPSTNAAVVPVNLALELGLKNTALYKVAVPFSYQFCYRYFFGLDLDYQKVAVETAKSYRSDRGNAKYLLILSAAHGGMKPHTNMDFNRERYERL